MEGTETKTEEERRVKEKFQFFSLFLSAFLSVCSVVNLSLLCPLW